MNVDERQQQVTVQEQPIVPLPSILDDVLGNNAISRTFKLMEIAEGEITRAIKKAPHEGNLAEQKLQALGPEQLARWRAR